MDNNEYILKVLTLQKQNKFSYLLNLNDFRKEKNSTQYLMRNKEFFKPEKWHTY